MGLTQVAPYTKLRLRSALIMGDVHPVEPVVETDDAEEERALGRSGCALDAASRDPYRVRARCPSRRGPWRSARRAASPLCAGVHGECWAAAAPTGPRAGTWWASRWERSTDFNVAASRARVHLVVVGDPDVLSRGEVTRELVRAARVG